MVIGSELVKELAQSRDRFFHLVRHAVALIDKDGDTQRCLASGKVEDFLWLTIIGDRQLSDSKVGDESFIVINCREIKGHCWNFGSEAHSRDPSDHLFDTGFNANTVFSDNPNVDCGGLVIQRNHPAVRCSGANAEFDIVDEGVNTSDRAPRHWANQCLNYNRIIQRQIDAWGHQLYLWTLTSWCLGSQGAGEHKTD